MQQGKYRVIITDNDFEDATAEQAILSPINAFVQKYQTTDEKEVISLSQEADIVMCDSAPISSKVILNAKRLKGIIEYGYECSNIDIPEAIRRGIKVANVPKYITDEVSEHAMALALSLLRKIPLLDAGVRKQNWDWKSYGPMRTLAGKVCGVIGLGRFGTKTAERCLSFGMQVIAYDPFVHSAPKGVSLVTLEVLLQQSDIVFVHCPLTKQTYHLFGRQEFFSMKKSSILINTSRGDVIDQDALIAALSSGEIAGAGLDVFKEEPIPPGDSLLSLRNVLLSPHIAWYSEESALTLRRSAANEALQILSGLVPDNLVTKRYFP
jgi:D-3-phosphoglycerate dehydrogenase